ncbi:hypothetical protein FDP41_002058 [Naegleria fowleri]|uniref:Deoxynucleoside kinase domain-containing protein n=1 Tax=Naegleria fowleri TaxID=5763 RepID=A0A6A5BZ82_NAEFO|nr:uncharacterized protein FDP41_002058 [Naegleria fowleri]KAF0978988.1 hypothetical protein FDP41_002058 [Naegleria fowleri]CAG4713720.1 unnamed protein product [Naegleria fowleri]
MLSTLFNTIRQQIIGHFQSSVPTTATTQRPVLASLSHHHHGSKASCHHHDTHTTCLPSFPSLPTTSLSSYSSNNIFVICVDGNIGVGKSLYCHLIQQFIKREFNDIPLCHVIESVEKNIDLFKLYLSNQREYGLEFQKWIIIDKVEQFVEQYKQTNSKRMIVLMDRSLLADRHVFVRNLVEKNLMTSEQHASYVEYFEHLLEKYPRNLFYPDFHIVIDACIDTALERINRRNRVGESSVYTKDYLDMIERFHKDMYQLLAENNNNGVNRKLYRFDNNTNHNITSIDQIPNLFRSMPSVSSD